MMYVYISLYLSIDSGLHLVGIYTFGSISIYVDLFGYVNNDLENHVLSHLLNGLWVYQNNMEHSLHHSIFQRIFRGWGDP